MINPLTQNKYNIVAYFSVWLLIALIQWFTLYFFLNLEIYDAMVDSFVFNSFYSIIGLSFWYMSRYLSFENLTISRLLVNHFAAAIVTTGIWIGGSYLILIKMLETKGLYLIFLPTSLIWRFFIGIMYYTIITILNYVIIFYSDLKEKQIREAKLNSLVKDAELKTLKYQINPHFIFNSLNSISSLTISSPAKAQEMTIKLSEFMRRTFKRNETQTIKFSEELNSVKIYLDIEKIRFEDNFEYVTDFNSDLCDLEVPAMILQPVFENAIKHSVYESTEKVIIKLTCEETEEYYKIIVSNNFDPEAVPRKGEGIGLKNIQKRMELIYKQDNLLTFKKEDNMFYVFIFIPKPERKNE